MQHVIILAPLLLAIPLLAGCAGGGDYPALLPTDQVLAEPSLPDAPADPGQVTAETSARADALNARAEALRGPVIEPETARRMAGAGT